MKMSQRQRKVRELNSPYIEQHETELKLKSSGKKGIFRRLTALGIFVIVAAIVTAFTLHSQQTVLDQKLEKKYMLENQLASLQLEERDLKDEIHKLNDLEYISEIARRDYYLTKPGEIIFKIATSPSD